MADLLSEREIAELVKRHIQDNPELIFAVKPKFLHPEEVEYAISKKPELFRRWKEKTFNLCMVALSLDGFNLEFIEPEEFSAEQYERLCWTAVEQNPKSIVLVPKDFRTKELKSYAYAHDPELLLSENKVSESMVESMLEHDPSLIQYVENPTDELIIKALTKDPRVIVYFRTISSRVKDFFEERYPQYAAMVIHD